MPYEYIPAWRDLNPPPSPVLPAKRKPRPSAKKKAAAAQIEDAESRGTAGRSTPVAINEEESASESVVSVSRTRTKRGKPNPANMASKRELQQSPSQPTPTSKKARFNIEPGIPSAPVDLSLYEFNEDSELNTTLIPKAAGVVSFPSAVPMKSSTKRVLGLFVVFV